MRWRRVLVRCQLQAAGGRDIFPGQLSALAGNAKTPHQEIFGFVSPFHFPSHLENATYGKMGQGTLQEIPYKKHYFIQPGIMRPSSDTCS